jgi:hypothetical protein
MKLIDAMAQVGMDGYIARESKPENKIFRSKPGFYETPPTLQREDRMAADWECYE